jgi:hypothetical protein
MDKNLSLISLQGHGINRNKNNQNITLDSD